MQLLYCRQGPIFYRNDSLWILVYVAWCKTAHTHWSQKYLKHQRLLTMQTGMDLLCQWIGPELHYVEGSESVVADTFSWLLRKDTLASPVVGKKLPAEYSIDEDDVNETPLDNYFLWVDDREMFDCFKCLSDKECHLNGLLGEIYSLLTFGFQCTKHRILYFWVLHLHIWLFKYTHVSSCIWCFTITKNYTL